MAFSSIREVIQKRSARYRSQDAAVLLSIEENWEETANSLNLEKGTKPTLYKNGNLFLLVSSLAEAAQIRLQKERIKKEINSFLKKNFIKDIRFQVKKSK